MAENMNEELLLTKEGYDKIVAEHEELVSVRRAEVAERLKEAISYGDISENAEYMIRKAKIVQEEDVKGDVVSVGLKVTVKDLDSGEEETFSIVGATESDPFNGKISTDSSVGKTLIGHKKGDKVAVEIPDGIINYEILSIDK